MFRFIPVVLIGLLLLYLGIRLLQDAVSQPGDKKISLHLFTRALQAGTPKAAAGLLLTIIGAVIGALTLFVTIGALIVMIFDPL